MKPKQDYMLLERQARKSQLIVPDGKGGDEMTPFKVLAIGPGRYDHGKFIASELKPGDLVFMGGGVIQVNYDGQPRLFGREKDVVATL